MIKINIPLEKKINDSYQIKIEKGIFNHIGKEIENLELGNKACIISDKRVATIYGLALQKNLRKQGIRSSLLTFTPGEKSKNLKTIDKLGEKMINENFDRKDFIIALGGGITGDIAGFLSSIYLRGIKYIQIPTSLLAMVDSSVGGKTGVNLNSGKNLIGTFTQAQAVFIDPTLLSTLPLSELKNGLAEVIKYGVIEDYNFFEYLEKNISNIKKNKELNYKILEEIISKSCNIKAKIVELDEKETNIRMILNYGHSYGHAIEKSSNYNIKHGNAIALGMILINKYATSNKLLAESDSVRIKNLLKKSKLPVELPIQINTDQLNKLLQYDKKTSDKKIKIIVPRKIGKVEIIEIDLNEIQ